MKSVKSKQNGQHKSTKVIPSISEASGAMLTATLVGSFLSYLKSILQLFLIYMPLQFYTAIKQTLIELCEFDHALERGTLFTMTRFLPFESIQRDGAAYQTQEGMVLLQQRTEVRLPRYMGCPSSLITQLYTLEIGKEEKKMNSVFFENSLSLLNENLSNMESSQRPRTVTRLTLAGTWGGGFDVF